MPEAQDILDLYTLKEASRVFFKGNITEHTLRAAVNRNELRVSRIGRVDFVTRTHLEAFVTLCLEKPSRRDFTKSLRPEIGLSETDASCDGLDAVLQSASKLKSRSPNTSGKSTRLKPARRTQA
ncbi:helix-turn-helix domain-containing protein [Brucella sp. HL-2]|nr:helix-turn-helix domain-containing protein [Brucella sp. HL-2]MCV9910212.1 helix-turn-helix domain-containing protein [Brucella sp. HL-2]